MSDVRLAEAILYKPVLEDLQLVTVRVMKRKFLDQVLKLSEEEHGKVTEMLGVCEHRVLFRLDNGNIRFIHRLDWIKTKMDEIMTANSSVTFEAANTIANVMIDCYPQIYAE